MKILFCIIIFLTACVSQKDDVRVPGKVKQEWIKINRDVDNKGYFATEIAKNLALIQKGEEFVLYWGEGINPSGWFSVHGLKEIATEIRRYQIDNYCPDPNEHIVWTTTDTAYSSGAYIIFK